MKRHSSILYPSFTASSFDPFRARSPRSLSPINNLDRYGQVRRPKFRTKLGTGYSLPRDLSGTHARELYVSYCTMLELKLSPLIYSAIPDDYVTSRKLTVLSFVNMYIGDVGIGTLLPVIAACTHLRELYLPDNGISDQAGKMLVSYINSSNLMELVLIDISTNPVGSVTGRLLIELAESSHILSTVKVNNTKIPRELQNHLRWILSQHIVHVFEDEDLLEPQKKSEKRPSEPKESDKGEVLLPPPILGHKRPAESIPLWALHALADMEEIMMKYKYRLSDVFSYMDIDKDNMLSFNEFFTGCKEMNIVSITLAEDPSERCDVLFNLLDGDDDGSLSFPDFAAHFMSRKVNERVDIDTDQSQTEYLKVILDNLFDANANLEETFESIDKDGSGKIDQLELGRGLSILRVGGPFGFLEDKKRNWIVKEIFHMIDRNGNKAIEWQEFVTYFGDKAQNRGRLWSKPTVKNGKAQRRQEEIEREARVRRLGEEMHKQISDYQHMQRQQELQQQQQQEQHIESESREVMPEEKTPPVTKKKRPSTAARSRAMSTRFAV